MMMVALHLPDFRVILSVYSIFALIFCISTCQERKLVSKVNPDCPDSLASLCGNETKEVKVVHVRADGPNDTLHYVWAFHPKPTVLVARTSHATNLRVSWNDVTNFISRIDFTPEPIYSFGIVINKVFEFNDVNDTGLLDMNNNSVSYINRINMPDSWETDRIQQNLDSVLVTMKGTWKNQSSSVKGGFIRIELETYRKQDHGSKLPHLLHSSNATQIELGLINMTTKSGFQMSRFAAEFIMAANESIESRLFNKTFQSLDDEHTPGVFSLVDLQTQASKESGNGGYLQWRPVAYVAEERDIMNSTETAYYPEKNMTNCSSEYEGTLLATFFGANLKNKFLSGVNISFGAKEDGFYSKNKVSIWTLTAGYGHPPEENFSMLIILIMSICLGLPALIIVLSGLYVAHRRISYRKDDLLLSE